MKSKDIIRRCRFTPYRKGMGPVFRVGHQPHEQHGEIRAGL